MDSLNFVNASLNWEKELENYRNYRNHRNGKRPPFVILNLIQDPGVLPR